MADFVEALRDASKEVDPAWVWCKENNYNMYGMSLQTAREIYERDHNHPSEQRRAVIEAERQKLLSSFYAEVPEAYRKASLEDFVVELRAKAVTLQDCIILGENRVGKTHLMWSMAMMHKKANPRATVKVVKCFEMMQSMKKTTYWMGYLADNYKDVDYLYIDEVDKIICRDSEYSYLNWLVDERHEHRKPTVMTANGTMQDLLQTIGQSIVARLTNRDEGGDFIKLTANARVRRW